MLCVDQIDKTLAFVIDLICNILIGGIPFLLVVHWLLFVEYTLHQSRDIVWRRYPVAMIPFAVGMLVSIFSMTVPVTDSTPRVIYDMVYICYILGKVIWVCYVIASYVILYREKKRKRIPQYILLTPTVLCIAVGMVLSLVTSYLLDALGYALGLMFADYFMFRRLNYIDPDTGFFNEKYIGVLKSEAQKQDIENAMLIRFKTNGDNDKLAKILKFWEPEHSKTVVMNNGEFLILSEIHNKKTAERFINMVSEHCDKEGVKAEASYDMLTDIANA